MTDEKHCATCICGKRANVQRGGGIERGQPGHVPGTITWAEYLLAFADYANRFGRSQSAERLNERGGLCYLELTDRLGRAPETWEPKR